mgnify:CR=1 FL=1
MAKFSSGKYAQFISDRSGMAFPYQEMVVEWTGARVHTSEFEPKSPQVSPKPHGADGIALRNVRTDRVEPAVAVLLGNNPFSITASSQTITVTEPNHGRSTGNTVRFRNAEGSLGLTSTDLNKSAGFTITKVDANNYTFVAAGTATANTNIGGGSISAGPVTLSP